MSEKTVNIEDLKKTLGVEKTLEILEKLEKEQTEQKIVDCLIANAGYSKEEVDELRKKSPDWEIVSNLIKRLI